MKINLISIKNLACKFLIFIRSFRPSDLFVAAGLPTFAPYICRGSYTHYKKPLGQKDSHLH